MAEDRPLDFVILGGGTAGWMAACLLAEAWPQHRVTLVESPDIGIIGVGEGSTPQLRAFFARLGLAEADWMPRCNATYKNGIRFDGWSDRPGFTSYFHPFQSDLDGHSQPAFFRNCAARRTGRQAWAHPDRFFLAARLAADGLAPLAADNFPFDIGYGYHFDALLVGQVLRDHAVGRLGVRHLARTVAGVELAGDGAVAVLRLDGDDRVAGDYFLDCSGFRSTIAQGALAVPFITFADNLFADRAVAMPTGHAPGAIPCETRATALTAGWAWSIPLTNRVGNGYVYASDFLSADAAESELRTHLGLLDADVPVRHLQMRVGRVAESWHRNCLAVGLSQGFIEPLEATALHIVQATVEGFIAALADGGFTPRHRAAFNTAIAARYDGIRDYIVGHYRLNQRAGDYWRANATNNHLSDSLKSLLTCWFTGRDLAAEVAGQNIGQYYSALSWHALLAGYGTFPDDAKLRPAEADLGLADMGKIDEFIARCARNFAPHDAALAALRG